ncbi:U6 snRNA phosphodiesterase 1 isoform X1 [Conger conger]|uniref:U6 snRNA phosphodiesterase 1 isoform X1 n=2 Tax=Conger conger TaxID=82655 RepID=UPI002A5A635F|nr:U6 snRNA phosphodiesterase 1 isoform X1 [Conger conger]XP_061078423.1 U6 snRNA phosphodiesterase 1 isoform X1 [Conger conger]
MIRVLRCGMLVSYSSSSEDDEENEDRDKRKHKGFKNDDCAPACKKLRCVTTTRDGRPQTAELHRALAKPRLPLPGSVLEMFRETEDPSVEDSSLHGGRVRSFQHERGNWATYVYLPYDPDEVFLELVGAMMQVVSAHGLSLNWAEEFHVSLSQTVVLRHHWIQPFVLSLRTGLASYPRMVCLAEKMKVYTNDAKTRTFLGVEITTGHAQLLEVVRAVDQTMEEFSLDTFYKNPSFHMSLAWSVGNCVDQLSSKCLQELQATLDSHEDGSFLLRLACEELRCKSGNKVFTFPLRSPLPPDPSE